MKGAAKCDNRCELQNSVNQWPLERALRSLDMPESMSAAVLLTLYVSCCSLPLRAVLLHATALLHWHAQYQVLPTGLTDHHLVLQIG